MGYAYEVNMGLTSAEVFGLIASLLSGLLSFGLGIGMYVLQSWGLYTIAARRQLKNPWLAWLPIGNLWILGSLSDQYQYVTTGRVRNRRKVLLGLNIAMCVLFIIVLVVFVGMIVNAVGSIPNLQFMSEEQILSLILEPLLSALWVGLLASVLAVVYAVFQYIALYDLYRSCEPRNSVLYLVLSIFLSYLLPVFIFLCRKKDEGMPPRRTGSLLTEDHPAQSPEF